MSASGPEDDLGTVVPHVCYRLTNGQQRLKARSSAFDPKRPCAHFWRTDCVWLL